MAVADEYSIDCTYKDCGMYNVSNNFCDNCFEKVINKKIETKVQEVLIEINMRRAIPKDIKTGVQGYYMGSEYDLQGWMITLEDVESVIKRVFK